MQLVSSCATAQPARVVQVSEFELGVHYRDVVKRVGFDPTGNSWVATTQTLYRVSGGSLQAEDTAGARSRRLALGPTGEVYVWLSQGSAPAALFDGEVWETPKRLIGRLQLPAFPHGFASLFMGGNGRLIVTISPLNDPEGRRGDFLYVFWSRDGRELSRVTLDKRLAPIVDVTGEAMLVMGESDAIAFRNDGQQLWKVDGRFRNGALAGKGEIALLNPADAHAIREVRVYNQGKLTSLTLSAPVSELALTGDGSLGALGVGDGEVLLITPPSCNIRKCRTPQQIPGLDRSTIYRVTALRFMDANTLAIGRIQRVDSGDKVTYPAAEVVATSIGSAKPLFRRLIPLKQPATWSPSLDATFGVLAFAAYTPDRALIVTLAK
jgi:hypothetical protein